ncbi:Hvo_1808 family surface protein [Haladaptatus sp. ZSTT2]|uniref:Hvo_1808 family surface protein n=1 Tax=Haladaptatus sp. ZSTT2 TaxID=3120515 RepID=UPI00300E7678
MARTRSLVALAFLVVLSGCVGGLLGPQDDPDDDTLGWENGYWHDDPLSIDESDGLNETERKAVIARTMARVEVIRGLEFKESVSVTLISREEYRARRGNDDGEPTDYDRWNEQVWEGLFLVSEDDTVSDAFGGVYGSAVQGYYSGGGEITLVSDSATPMVDRTTLSHELVHALQDQHFGFPGGRTTQDGELAADGLTEGDANYVEQLYESRCQAEWDCIARPDRGTSSAPDDFNRGVFSVIYQPYAEGPTFVESLRDRGGWEAVNAAYDDVPESTEQVIHPEDYPDDRPVELDVPDRSSGGWERFSLDTNADTVGEASIYAMLWANGVVTDQSPYAYAFPASTGWAGDSLVPYHNGDAYGYVWVTEWESEEDAREFHDAYRQVLERNGADPRGDGVYRIPEGEPFADAFRVTRSGTRVKIVNAPTVRELANIDG